MQFRVVPSSYLCVCIQYSLFRFDASSHALSVNSYLREQRHELSASVGINSVIIDIFYYCC